MKIVTIDKEEIPKWLIFKIRCRETSLIEKPYVEGVGHFRGMEYTQRIHPFEYEQILYFQIGFKKDESEDTTIIFDCSVELIKELGDMNPILDFIIEYSYIALVINDMYSFGYPGIIIKKDGESIGFGSFKKSESGEFKCTKGRELSYRSEEKENFLAFKKAILTFVHEKMSS